MSRATIDFGIDLGTTNSSIAVINGVSTEVIKNNDNEELTPSAVWADRNGTHHVGKRAKNQVGNDDENALAEFKLLMGTDFIKHFPRSGKRMTPEQLSAEVVKELRGAVRQRTGEDIQAAVITVPAAFELPQCEATKRAAELAGLTTCALLQEPIAAALAHGFQRSDNRATWLVYDIGGGTFDAAVLQLKDGLIQVLTHEGDNALGGKLIDWKIVEKILMPEIEKEFRVSEFRRGNPMWKTAIAKLKHLTEERKIALSRNQSEWVEIDFNSRDGFDESVQFEYEVSRDKVQELARPLIARSINLCKKALTDKRLSIEAVDKVILVGGPTLAPYVREQLLEWIGVESKLDYSIDPLTVVSRGAAIFASAQRIDTFATASVPAGTFALELDYKPVDVDEEPLIAGTVLPAQSQSLAGYTIEFTNQDSRPQWRSGKIPLNPAGSFLATLWAERGKANRFLIELWNGRGTKCKTTPDQITYTIGATISEQLLTKSIGLELQDGSVKRLFDRGTHLPARTTLTLQTTISLKSSQVNLAGAKGSIRMPLIEGENLSQSNRNRLIGDLEINPSQVERDVYVGSEIELTVYVDESRTISAKAYVGFLDEEFDISFNLGTTIQVDPEKLDEDIQKEINRLTTVEAKVEYFDLPEAKALLNEVTEGEIDIDLLDPNSIFTPEPGTDLIQTRHSLLQSLKENIDRIENVLFWPSLSEEADRYIVKAKEQSKQHATPEERKRLRLLETELRQAIDGREAELARPKLEEVKSLYYEMAFRDVDYLTGYLDFLEERRNTMADQAIADHLFRQGRRAQSENNAGKMFEIIKQLFSLMPEEQKQASGENFGYGSTVMLKQ